MNFESNLCLVSLPITAILKFNEPYACSLKAIVSTSGMEYSASSAIAQSGNICEDNINTYLSINVSSRTARTNSVKEDGLKLRSHTSWHDKSYGVHREDYSHCLVN